MRKQLEKIRLQCFLRTIYKREWSMLGKFVLSNILASQVKHKLGDQASSVLSILEPNEDVKIHTLSQNKKHAKDKKKKTAC